MVANTKERPDGADIARVNEVAPRTRKDHRSDDNAGPPLFVRELRPNLAHHFLQEETTNTGAGVHSRQDEHRFKHNGEVVPIGHQIFHKGNLREDVSHANSQRNGAARAGHQAFLDLGF